MLLKVPPGYDVRPTPDLVRQAIFNSLGGRVSGARVPGPAIIAEDETSTFITASFDARIDAAGCIVMERRVGA